MSTTSHISNPTHTEKPVVYITAKCHPWLIEALSQKHEVHYLPVISYEELLEKAGLATGLIITTRLQIDKQAIDKIPLLQWIGRLGSGLEQIDITYAASKGIRVLSSPEGNSNAVAEHALGMLLGVLNRVVHSHHEVRQGIWLRDANRGTELRGKTVGIIGYGNTGSAFARLLQPFGVTVLAYDKYKFGFAEGYIKEASLEQVQRYCDVISFHIPLTAHTQYMADEAFFSSLGQQPIIINTSRGKVLKLDALKQAIESGKVSGACLDVLENEKLDTYTPEEHEMLQWLTTQPNIIVTPHTAGYSHEALLRMAEVVYGKIFG